jgi:hypothetical protein
MRRRLEFAWKVDKIYLIQPHFYYCSIVWDSFGKGLGQKLQRLQNRAARLVLLNLITTLNWTNLETRRTRQFLKNLVYKTVNNMVPSYTCQENLLQLL